MKKILLLLVLLASIYSCTKESDDVAANLDYSGKWVLIKMTGSWTGSVDTGSEMAWQETYIINDDDTFTKTRVTEDTTIIVSGTYSFAEDGLLDESESNVLRYINFIHDTDNNIIGSCYSKRTTENLYFNADNKLISTWEACDGPGLEYMKK